MRKVGLYLCLVTGLLVSNSCSKKADVVKPVYPISAYIGNYQWFVNSVSCTLTLDTSHGDRIVDITATSNGKTLTMEFYDYSGGNAIGGGTHTIPADAYFNYFAGTGSSFKTVSGSVTITANNPSSQSLSAAFDYVVQDNNSGAYTHISNGMLNNVEYSVIYK